ncbi:type I-B CRISPR-associated protein Cas7/Cst2/DevR [Fodinisporobacter ferrooxydans]|uniref:Type I-B CRISPR-associated protein Cas7/Cst2/DevR n=1 Tax=Fodinisporobacter ferrooxydans TaxID=2901836 RepID=A0ABY4CPS6_9BACL|nr:type I-B CRISPR-associated protein Cas7/Cst2/DevR [Alicyclobacillaceae bacterium MYW30-H2]
MKKAIGMNWLARADLSNLNSGEGIGNLTQLKLYRGNQYPYNSGQAVRHALFETLQREHGEVMKCLPESPCGQIETCWACDLRGYLIAEKLDENAKGTSDKRWSPLKVTPALGTKPVDLTTDLLLQFTANPAENRIANIQLTENIYRIGMCIDIANIGRQEKPVFIANGRKEKFSHWQESANISDDQRRQRVHAVLDAVYRLSGFAKQARGAVSLAPEVMFLSVQDHYHQRGLDVLLLDDEGNADISRVISYIQDRQFDGDQVLFAYTPGVITNGEEMAEAVRTTGLPVLSVRESFEKAKALVE